MVCGCDSSSSESGIIISWGRLRDCNWQKGWLEQVQLATPPAAGSSKAAKPKLDALSLKNVRRRCASTDRGRGRGATAPRSYLRLVVDWRLAVAPHLEDQCEEHVRQDNAPAPNPHLLLLRRVHLKWHNTIIRGQEIGTSRANGAHQWLDGSDDGHRASTQVASTVRRSKTPHA
jgi:hypothetical protein